MDQVCWDMIRENGKLLVRSDATLMESTSELHRPARQCLLYRICTVFTFVLSINIDGAIGG